MILGGVAHSHSEAVSRAAIVAAVFMAPLWRVPPFNRRSRARDASLKSAKVNYARSPRVGAGLTRAFIRGPASSTQATRLNARCNVDSGLS